MSKKQILLNAFSMNCVGHINHGLWTHPRDRSSDYRKLRHWTELARLLERGCSAARKISALSAINQHTGLLPLRQRNCRIRPV